MIIAHGNADFIDRWVDIAGLLSKKRIGVLLVEYPGYGRSTGNPSQNSITEVFIRAYDYIIENPEIDTDRIILLGQSVGGGAVCALAKERYSAGLILISSFTSVGVFAKDFLLPAFLVKDPFDNLSVISEYKGPVLLIHGENDDLVSYEESEKLLNASINGKFIGVKGDHNLPLNRITFWNDHILPFLYENNFIEKGEY